MWIGERIAGIAVDTLPGGTEVGDFGKETMSRDLVRWLEAANYAAWDSTLSGFQPHKPKEQYGYDNLIFAPVGVDITKV